MATTRERRPLGGARVPAARGTWHRSQREVIGVFSDAWRETHVRAWAMDVTVTSERGDVYKNQVSLEVVPRSPGRIF